MRCKNEIDMIKLRFNKVQDERWYIKSKCWPPSIDNMPQFDWNDEIVELGQMKEKMKWK